MRVLLAGLMCMVMMETSFGLEVPRARAYVVPVWVTLDTSPTSIERTTLAEKSDTREFVLDDIAFTIAKLALQQITKSIIQWINSGFKGSPAFITDLGAFLQNSADKIAGEVIYGSDLKALCSPFALNIRISLQLKYAAKDTPVRCTLSGVVNNVENFLGGNFASGGLPGWFEMTVNPNNNFFGASASAESFLFGRLQAKKEIDLNKLIWGSGFLSKEICEGTDDGKERCRIVTPGETISEALNFTLSTGERTLIEADEINEVISALFAQLAQQALQGAGGLLGLTSTGGDYGNTSYVDRINNPTFDKTPGQNNIGNDFIQRAIAIEEQFQALYPGIVSQADAILARIKELEALKTAGMVACSSMDHIRTRATNILPILRDLQARYEIATRNARYSADAADERSRIVEEFMRLQSSGALHSETDLARYQASGIDPLVTELTNLANELETLCHPTGGG